MNYKSENTNNATIAERKKLKINAANTSIAIANGTIMATTTTTTTGHIGHLSSNNTSQKANNSSKTAGGAIAVAATMARLRGNDYDDTKEEDAVTISLLDLGDDNLGHILAFVGKGEFLFAGSVCKEFCRIYKDTVCRRNTMKSISVGTVFYTAIDNIKGTIVALPSTGEEDLNPYYKVCYEEEGKDNYEGLIRWSEILDLLNPQHTTKTYLRKLFESISISIVVIT